ncbi:hypothetical protein [Azospirillum sp.]|uniref:hypothetical protein n=1 Tax=Azospirillum sp. TaxID=34012 RepID=UPI002D317E70|nr:hypothetical protein [Azospirillum sp.]HYD64538.1 hypothetical protein [Azospirillum sp.]
MAASGKNQAEQWLSRRFSGHDANPCGKSAGIATDECFYFRLFFEGGGGASFEVSQICRNLV